MTEESTKVDENIDLRVSFSDEENLIRNSVAFIENVNEEKQMIKSEASIEVANEEDLIKKSTSSIEIINEEKSHKVSYIMTMVYDACFFIFGGSSLLLSSAFITNSQFFKNTVSTSPNLFRFFESSITSVSFISLILANFINLTFWYKFSERIKIYFTFAIIICGFIATSIVIYKPMADESFFAAILVVLFLLNQCTPIVLGSFYTELAYFPPQCYKWYLAGQAFAGVFVPTVRVIVTAVSLDQRTTTIIFFAIGIIVMLSALIIYEILIRSKQYAIGKEIHLQKKIKQDVEVVFSIKDQWKSYLRIFKETWKEGIGLFLCLVVTLTIHPTMGLRVKSIYTGTIWANLYYTSVACFVTFNFGDFLGRYTGSYIKWPKVNSIWIILISLIRFCLIFLFLICNRPVKWDVFPSILNHDAAPILIEIIFGIINGHTITKAFQRPSLFKDPRDIKICYILFVFLLDCGLAGGAFLSYATATL